MAETRTKIARSQIDGSVCRTRFFTASQDFEDANNEVLLTDTDNYSERVRKELCASAVSALMKQTYQGVEDLTVTEALRRAREFVASLEDGTWTPGRGIGEAGPSDLEEALLQVFQQAGQPRTLEDIREGFDALSDKPEGSKERTREIAAGKRNMHSNPLVKRALAEIAQRKAREAAAKARKAKPDENSASNLFSLFAKPQSEAAE